MMDDERRSPDLDPTYDPDTGAYHVRFGPTAGTSLAATVVGAVAAVAGVRATALDDVLDDRVDPDALNALFRRARGRRPAAPDAGVWFTLAGHRVVARSDGDVAIYPPHSEDPDGPVGPGRGP